MFITSDDNFAIVIASFHDHIWAERFNEHVRSVFFECHDVIDHLEMDQNLGTIHLIHHRTIRSLQPPATFIIVYADDDRTKRTGEFSRVDQGDEMTRMKNIKATVGKDYLVISTNKTSIPLGKYRLEDGRIITFSRYLKL